MGIVLQSKKQWLDAYKGINPVTKAIDHLYRVVLNLSSTTKLNTFLREI